MTLYFKLYMELWKLFVKRSDVTGTLLNGYSVKRMLYKTLSPTLHCMGGGPRVVVSTAAFHARAWGSVPGLSGLKETKIVSSPSTCESQYCGEPP